MGPVPGMSGKTARIGMCGRKVPVPVGKAGRTEGKAGRTEDKASRTEGKGGRT